MRSFREIEKPEYGICLNSCKCQVFNPRRSHNGYKVLKRGCLAKFQYRKWKSGSVRTLVINESEVYMQDSLHYISIDLKLFKYLNAINDFEERLKFYNNEERREFVLNLERNSIVSVGFSSGKQTQAVFQEINENEEKIFITVELLERPSKYSLPANMVHTIESTQRDKRCCLKKCLARVFCCCYLGPSTPNFDYSTLEYWRYYGNDQNGTTSNVSRRKSVFNGVESVKKKVISQNPEGSGLQENYHEPYKNRIVDRSDNKAWNDEPRDFYGKTVGRNSKRDENRCEARLDSVLIAPSSGHTELLTNSEVCHQCSNVRKDNICINCANEAKNIFGLIDSKNNVDSNISRDTSLPTNILINSNVCIECLSVYEGNICPRCALEKISAQNNSLINVDSNISSFSSLSSETPKNSFEINHAINNWETNGDHLPYNSKVAVKRNNEYEQFKASYKQQCFDKNCGGYHLWEERGEERPFTFTCNKCKLENCVKCVTIHVNLTCEQYDKIRNSVDNETVEVFLTWIREGIAMPCPNCEALIEKDEGCDWVQCPFCNIEICWATRGPRWGPNGKDDTSGGCGCDFKVKKCVENCNYCH